MGQDYTEEDETQLAIEIINLFQRERLTAMQAKSLIERVRVLIDAGEMGLFQQSH
jgi:hypothetical protein